MWCKGQAATALVALTLGWLTGETSEALSTFGRSHDPPKEVTSTPPGQPCSRQSDCAGISGSSCVRTLYDPVTRCLCGDNTTPRNGKCDFVTKGLYHVCKYHDECDEAMLCEAPNVTSSSPPHMRVYSPQDWICQCDYENGYNEKDYTCSDASDAEILKSSLFAILVVTFIRKAVQSGY